MARASILIVDTDQELTKILGAFLNAQGLRVNVATRVRDAATKLTLQKYSAVILEPDLGKERGEDVIRAAADGASMNSKTPFILTTKSLQHELPADVVPKLRAILPKPFRFEELLGCISSADVTPSSKPKAS